MMTLSLLCVLGIARAIAMVRFDLDGVAALGCFWEDWIVVICFAAFERFMRPQDSAKQTSARFRRATLISVYVLIVTYTALNVPVTQLFGTPLTPPMLRATGATLSDSISHHATAENILGVACVAALGFALPLIKMVRPPASSWLCATLAAAAFLSWQVFRQTETHGLHRNAIVALLQSIHPRLPSGPSAPVWRNVAQTAHPTALDLARFKAGADGRNVVLILLESTGASYLAPYGAEEDPMPNLTSFAANAILFEHAYAVYPESIKGIYSVLSSRYPAMETRAEEYCHIGHPALPEILRRAGYKTALFHSGRFMYLGMDSVLHGRGFDFMVDAGTIGGNEQSSFGVDEPLTIDRMLEWIDQLAPSDRFFLTYLPIAGHHPYFVPQAGPFPESDEPNRYRNALHYADASLGTLFEGLKRRGLWNRTLFVIAGDHGEAFGEHPGNFGHTFFVFEENVRVPLLIGVPGWVREPARSPAVASLVDLAPTILDLVGLETPPEFEGVTLLDTFPQAAFFFTDYSLGLLGMRDRHWKYIFELDRGRDWLFDLRTDPAEQSNLASAFPERASDYRDRVLSASAAHLQTFLRESQRARDLDCGSELELKSDLFKRADLADAQPKGLPHQYGDVSADVTEFAGQTTKSPHQGR